MIRDTSAPLVISPWFHLLQDAVTVLQMYSQKTRRERIEIVNEIWMKVLVSGKDLHLKSHFWWKNALSHLKWNYQHQREVVKENKMSLKSQKWSLSCRASTSPNLQEAPQGFCALGMLASRDMTGCPGRARLEVTSLCEDKTAWRTSGGKEWKGSKMEISLQKQKVSKGEFSMISSY